MSAPLVGYALVFVVVGAGFILVHLLIGKLLRPNKPDAEKKTIYECGEPTIGSAWIQFDLRFYVVALLFVIFDVEVAFFFPWAEVFGKANAVAAASATPPATEAERKEFAALQHGLIPPFRQNGKELEKYDPEHPTFSDADHESARRSAGKLSWLALGEILVFFGVLLVGFAYLWRRGDLQWVRSTLAERPETVAAPAPAPQPEPAPLVGAGSGH
jgi:NADH-quinone oxidoreductase subunit A